MKELGSARALENEMKESKSVIFLRVTKYRAVC